MTSLNGPDIVLTVCRDEADIIEAFVRFNLAMGFDAVYAVDNGSSDGTDLILKRLADEGLPLILKRDLRTGYDLHLTEHYHWAGSTARPRWLFFLDADEFLHFPDGAKDYLRQVPDKVTALRLLQRQMYQSDLEPAEPDPWFFLRTPVAGTTFDDEPSKVVTRYDPDARVFGGKHMIEGPTLRERIPDDLYIRHFKYRSAAQALSKERNRVASEAVFSDQDIQQLSAFNWQETKDWMQESRAMAEREEWRTWFRPERPLAFDDVLARWAAVPPAAGSAPTMPKGLLTLPAVERLLALEAERQSEVANGRRPTVALSGGSDLLERHMRGLDVTLAMSADDADLLLVRADAPGADLHALAEVISGSVRPRARALVRVEIERVGEMVDAARGVGMHAMRFDRTLYGPQTHRAAGLGPDEALVSVTRLERPVPATRNPAA